MAHDHVSLHNQYAYSIERYGARMESHHLLSNNQFWYITSQQDKLSEQFNKSQDLKRIRDTVKKSFETFDLIINSKSLDQKAKNKIFPEDKIDGFIWRFLQYNTENSLAEENHKLKVANRMIRAGLYYYQQRYSKVRFFKQKITEIGELLEGLEEIATVEESETEAMQFYNIRGKYIIPPRIPREHDKWHARCDICWNYAAGESKPDAMKAIRHHLKCPYKKAKHDPDWVIRTYPPLENKKAS